MPFRGTDFQVGRARPPAHPEQSFQTLWEAKPAAPFTQIQQYFNFTPAEARIAEQLAQGIDPTSIGEELHVTMATVRTHMHSIFHKTGTTRQGEAIALLYRLMTTPMP
jgi:DNA-binding CsgD family transcriptional regulator